MNETEEYLIRLYGDNVTGFFMYLTSDEAKLLEKLQELSEKYRMSDAPEMSIAPVSWVDNWSINRYREQVAEIDNEKQ